jgi:uncharacterized protein YecE (DUF72 family)
MASPPQPAHHTPIVPDTPELAIGTAGWSIPRAVEACFPGPGTHLKRYARILQCAEIDTSFSRPHQAKTYERWAASTPDGFRFSVKVPRLLTHEGGLQTALEPLEAFLDQVAGLGNKLGALLVQLPPSLEFDMPTASTFLEGMRRCGNVNLVWEPRHRTWFSTRAEALLQHFHVARAAVDPAPVPQAARPGGWLGSQCEGARPLLYYRWHGSPRMYWSRYDDDWLRERARELKRSARSADCWCIFDNTAAGAALENALQLSSLTSDVAARTQDA